MGLQLSAAYGRSRTCSKRLPAHCLTPPVAFSIKIHEIHIRKFVIDQNRVNLAGCDLRLVHFSGAAAGGFCVVCVCVCRCVREREREMAMGFPMLLLVLVLEGLAGCCGFNLEARIPVIKNGAEGSYFGYSVAQHQSRNSSDYISDSWSVPPNFYFIFFS